MKKNIIKKTVSFLALTMVLAMPLITMAWSPKDIEFDEDESLLRNTGLGDTMPLDVIASGINWGLSLLGLIALVLLIYGGFLWMFAVGEEEQITKAKDIIKGALVGLVIILASYGIAAYVFQNLLSITGA